MTFDAGVAGREVSWSVRMRDFCHMADAPRVLFSLNDDLLGRIKMWEGTRKMRARRTIV